MQLSAPVFDENIIEEDEEAAAARQAASLILGDDIFADLIKSSDPSAAAKSLRQRNKDKYSASSSGDNIEGSTILVVEDDNIVGDDVDPLFVPDDADTGDNNDEERQFMATTKGTRKKHNAEANTTSYQTFAGDVEETTVDKDSVAGARKNATAVIVQAIPQDLEKGYRMATVPKKTPNRSLACDIGQCRRAKQCLSVNSSSSTNAMKHLKAAQGRSSIQTETTEGNRRRKVEPVNAAKAPALFKDDPKRFYEMLWTRLHFAKCSGSPNGKHLPMRKRLHHLILEVYHATKEDFRIDRMAYENFQSRHKARLSRLGGIQKLPSSAFCPRILLFLHLTEKWCVPHLSNCALQESYGTNLDPSKVGKIECRETLQKMRSVIEHLNKSPQGKQRFYELQDDLTKVIKRFLELWDPIDKYYDKRPKLSNLMSSLKEELRQLYSLIAPAGALMQ
ncbi:hypothetical protein Plhal304r1_c024g0082011 [Plasmopara halstedii]